MVHCLMGISRSATVICAYLVATARVTPHEALMAVKGNLLGGQGRPHRAMMGKNVAETMPMLREAQRGPNPGSSSSTSTSTISDVTSAPRG
ncbi:hypothetical protein EDB85DRAFT_2023476 [Lactarius pseudohatsudake]|nr:hypothetical protein EDB85DRAFT_2023476 [Lactarius pseudohatsudake]